MISLIAAVDEDFGIGKNNDLLCHLSEDLKFFKEKTLNKTIIMGRKTFESLGKVLPNRIHIVLTRDKNFKIENNNVNVETNIDNIIDKYKNSLEEVFIIGGNSIYKEFIPFCSKLYITKIHSTFDADTYFPSIDFNNYSLTFSSPDKLDTKSNIYFHFETYENINKFI